jgi:hypothetical protein
MVSMRATDQIIVNRVFMTSEAPHETREWMPGNDWTAQLTEIEQELAELPRKISPLSHEFSSRQAELIAKLKDYSERKVTRGGWKRHQVIKDDGNVLTEGEYFRSLDREGQRDYLKRTFDIRIEKATPDDSGATHGIRIIMDGEDHGVFAHPPTL